MPARKYILLRDDVLIDAIDRRRERKMSRERGRRVSRASELRTILYQALDRELREPTPSK